MAVQSEAASAIDGFADVSEATPMSKTPAAPGTPALQSCLKLPGSRRHSLKVSFRKGRTGVRRLKHNISKRSETMQNAFWRRRGRRRERASGSVLACTSSPRAA